MKMVTFSLFVALLALSPGPCDAFLNILPRKSNTNPNTLFKVYNDVRGNIKTVETFNDVTAQDLLRFGVIKILETNSVITNEALAANALSENYLPSYQHDKKYEYNAKEGKNMFYEVSFQNLELDRHVNDWMPLGTCRHNQASTPSTYTQGWSVGVATGANAKVEFAQIFGIKPSFQYDVLISAGLSGSLSCNVDGRKKLQFQIMTESVTMKNVKMRPIKIIRDYKYTNGIFATMEVGEWEYVEEYTRLNRRNVQLGCITDPEQLSC